MDNEQATTEPIRPTPVDLPDLFALPLESRGIVNRVVLAQRYDPRHRERRQPNQKP